MYWLENNDFEYWIGNRSIGGEIHVELDSIKFIFTIIQVKWKMVKGIIMVKTEEDWKYQL